MTTNHNKISNNNNKQKKIKITNTIFNNLLPTEWSGPLRHVGILRERCERSRGFQQEPGHQGMAGRGAHAQKGLLNCLYILNL